MSKYRYEIILSIIIGFYILIFSYLSITRLLSFNSHYYDLGIMHQTVYNTSKGRFLELTNPDTGNHISRLGIHFDPILAVFAPIYWLLPNPEVLLISQTIIIALGAIAIYLLAIKILKNRFYAMIFAFLYLNYYPLQFANLFDFHATMLLPFLLLFAFYFIEIKRYKLSLIFIIISLLTKENVGLTTFFLGLYIFFFKKEKKVSILISTISLVAFIFAIFYIIPSFRQAGHFALKYYSLNIFEFINKLFSFDSLKYLTGLLQPVTFLSIFSPFELLIATPEFLINLLSSYANMRVFYFHYTAILIPFIFIASIYGFKKISGFKIIKPMWIIIFLLFINLVISYRHGPFTQINYQVPEDKLKVVRTWQANLADENIKVSTTPRLAPFFTARRDYYNFLYDPGFWDMNLTENDIIQDIAKYEKADYVIIALDELIKEESLERKFYLHLRDNPKFKTVYRDRNIEVYKKI